MGQRGRGRAGGPGKRAPAPKGAPAPKAAPSPARAPEAGFAACAPGLERALVDELAAFGVAPEAEPGGATFRADRAGLQGVLLHGRIASRVLVRVASFRATTLEGLADHVRRAAWTDYVHPRQPVEVEVTSHRSRLRHRETVADKVANAVRDAARAPRRSEERAPRTPVGVWVRIVDDRVEVSVDAAGERLHRRGWRTEAGEAPLRENLAAAVLWLAEWRPGEPLLDPMCGSGTFPIEAATVAAGLPPGLGRRFALEDWPSHDAAAFAAARAAAREAPFPSPVWGSDVDPDVVAVARANARRAGVEVAFSVADVAAVAAPAPAGLVVANPPYGERLGGAREAWRALGAALRGPLAGWRWAVLSPGPALLAAAGLRGAPVATFPNGGLRVTLHVGGPSA